MKTDYRITIRKIEHIARNVLHIITDKPKGYTFIPGQATMVGINQESWREEKRPFTFTGLPSDDELQFIIKIYPSHDGVTEHLDTLKVGDGLIIEEPWGAINYKGAGTFIAGGAGITPFIAIFKDLNQKGQLAGNRLFYGNKAEKDIILKNNLESWLGSDVMHILSEEDNTSYGHGHITRDLLEKHQLNTSSPVYLCGPPPMMEAVTADLFAMGLEESHLVTEA